MKYAKLGSVDALVRHRDLRGGSTRRRFPPRRIDDLHRLTEIFDGPPGQEAYLLNPGDPGLLRQLDTIDATAASKRPMPGKTTIAAHVDHVQFGLAIVNRWAAGEANPWTGADWNGSWQRTTVTNDQWQALRERLRHEAETWRKVVATRTDWDDLGAAAALSTAAHTAYHLGAIRQILAGLNR